MSKHSLSGGDVAGLLELFATLQEKARARTGERFRIIVIQEAGLDGFWIHRVLQGEAACDALPLPNPAQRRRNDRLLNSTSTAGAHPAQRVV